MKSNRADQKQISLGAKFKLNIPKFQFQEVQKQCTQQEDMIADYEKNSQDMSFEQQLNNFNKFQISQQKKIFLPKLQKKRSITYEQNIINDPIQKKTQEDLFFELLRQNESPDKIYGPKTLKNSDMFDNKIFSEVKSVKQESKKQNMQPLSFRSDINKSDIFQASFKEDKQRLPKLIKRHMKNLSKIDQKIGEQFNASRLITEAPNKTQRGDNNFSINESIQRSDRMFELMGYNTNKTLKNYDCYFEETTPQQWVSKCLKSQGPHAQCPIYINSSYIWTNVWVIDYDQKSEKFIVKLKNGQTKEVIRLSLFFNGEDVKKFKERVEIAKHLQNQAQDELRFLKFVENISQNLVCNLTEKQKNNIFNKLYTIKKNKTITDKVKSNLRQKFIEQLMQEVEKDYFLFQKKNHVINLMGQIENFKTWEASRIRNRYIPKSYPYLGTIVQLDYSFNQLKDSLSPVILFNQQILIKTFLSIAQRQYSFQNVQLFNYKFELENLPMSIQFYENKQRSFHDNVLKNIHIQLRQFIRDEIQDKLRDSYNFYQSNLEQYQGSELRKIIKLVDSYFNTFIREFLFTQNINQYVQFIRSFLPPQFLNDEDIWIIRQQPLIQVNLMILQQQQKQPKKKEKKKKEGEQNDEQNVLSTPSQNLPDTQSFIKLCEDINPNQLIYLDPSINQIKQIMLGVLEKLVQTTNSLNYLEKDLVPLMELQQSASYQVDLNNWEIQNAVQKILKYIEIGLKQPLKILEDFNKYNFLLEENIQKVFKLLFGESKDPMIVAIDVYQVRDKLHEYKKAIREIENLCIDEKNTFLFQIRTKQAKDQLINKANELINNILQKLSEICIDNSERISDSYQQIIENLQIFPKDERQLVELKNNVAENTVNLAKIKSELLSILKFLEILDQYCFQFPDDKQESYWVLYSRPLEVLIAMSDSQRNISTQEEKFLYNLDIEKNNFLSELKQLYQEFFKIKEFSDYKNVKNNASIAVQFMEKIDKANEKVKNFNEREMIFRQNLSVYEDLIKLLGFFTPYYNLWMQGMEFDLDYSDWMSGPFLKMNFLTIERKINQTYQREIIKLIRKFEELNDMNAITVANELKQQIDKFISNMWVIEFLTTEAMSNPRRSAPHWKELFRETQLPNIEPNDEMTLINLINSGLTNFRDQIEEISKKAEKQWNIEKKMKEIEEIVRSQNIDLISYKQTGTYVLKSLDEVQQILDDQLNVMMMMKASPYIKPLLKQAATIEQKIILIQDTLEEIMKCQRGWMYLEPIFVSDDIKKKLQNEQRIFERIDIFWKETMQIFNKDPNIWDNIDTERMKNEFIGHNKSLEVIQKSLSYYLETKRRYFPRFYFLSDEELLEILADTKDPLKVQKHINKCFEAINLLDFTQKQTIKGMISAEKENVPFINEIDVNQGERKGNVEIWLVDIEKMMIQTLVKNTKDCMLDINTIRTQWVQNWPAQILLSVNMQRWTNGAEVAIQNSKLQAKTHSDIFSNQFVNITEYKVYLERQLQDIVNLVRKDLHDLVRMTLGAIIVLDVHAKDVITELQIKDCRDMNNFMWISQLRYYWDDDIKEPMMWVKMINAVIKYGFEYLGNSSRLVITPLTDRCYRTLMGAKHLQYGGAPEGPAGTGKTETVKDLAKALAVQCVVFNCSDGLNYLAMRKFFKGLASSGAWCCFDEFNRINLEVLSVIAQQVLSIQTAIKEKRKNFIFDDEEIAIVLSCAINITMNPGYAGRSDLPDNLKALFRPCAMMVPDYALISEIFLSSVGFSDARNLARKIVASLRLSSEQLSSQDHYDFGMRALKAILTAAGYLKRSMAGEIEDIVCLRALMDVNLPKFTINDVPLFLSITSDLFPGVNQPEIDYGKLQQSLIQSCQEKKLQPKQNFLQKCIQLYDTINVRHGLMVVGAAFSGKSSVIEALRSAMTRLKGIDSFINCVTIKLNPKSITSDQLYGKLDPDTKAWSDGIAAIIMRNAASDNKNPERKWILFDGPVDAIWIENMNTVLDDNKKLCLTSGEIIKLSNQMTMMFEVEDLAVASPATVSRCGMVFQETQLLGWIVLIQSYCQNLSSILNPHKQHLENYLICITDNTLAWCYKHAKFLVHKSEMNMICTLLKIVQTFIIDYEQEGVKLPKDIEEILNQIILFSTIWSIGAAIDEISRKSFSDYILHLVTANAEIPYIYKTELYLQYPFKPLAIVHKIPENTNIFDVTFVPKSGLWLNWTQTIEKYLITKGGEFNKIIVPTIDTIRNNYFLHKCVKNKYHLLLCGPTGTGKTANIINEINKCYFNAEYTNLCTSFSGQTRVNQVQRLIDSKISTRRRKGYYGPEEGKRQIVIFVDDVNMPSKEVFGAQPPIELLRQWKDHGGWYDLDTKEWKFLQDITFLTAMLPSGTQVTMRYLRHFFLLYVPPFEADSLTRIFSSILEWYFINLENPASNAVKNLSDNIVRSTIQIYNQIQNSSELLPTPAKSHYIYNLRDISKVFQGINKATIKSFNSDSDFIKLWANECERVFKDRLINDDDQDFFSTILKKIISQNFKKEWDDLVQIQPLMWASFVPCIQIDGVLVREVYCEVTDRDLLKQKCHEFLNQYNEYYSSNRMNLVLFVSALCHLVKIVRIITTSFGHAMLVGVGGSGRKSLATLSTFIAYQSETFQIDQKTWSEDLIKMMKLSGLDEREVVLLFSDTQISKESYLEDICNILNKGEVPNLFSFEEKAKLLEDIPAQGTPNEKYLFFIGECKKNLHLVLTFSPVGESFRRRLRTFPTLVNCTTIDWFLPWPQDALRSTANNHFIKTMNINDDDMRNKLVEIAVDMQLRISNLSKRYLEELRRYYYVTPTSYLELLSTFHKILSERTQEVDKQIIRYEAGVAKILETEVMVEKMQKELEELKPQLIIKTKENLEMLAILQVKQKEADEKREICEADEKDCTIIKDAAIKLSTECQAELDKVIPLLQGAAQALDKITKDDMNTLKSFVAPPVSAALVMEGLCYAFDEDKNVKWIAKPEGKPGEKIQDFWEYSKKKLLNDKLIKRVKDFKEDQIRSIPEKNVEKLKHFVKNPLFDKEKVFNASKAAGNLSLWVRAVVDTYFALLVVDPKKAELQIAEKKLQAAEELLQEKKNKLNEVMELLAQLQRDYDKARKEKEDLEQKVKKCQTQIERADKLISGLAGEKVSWSNKAVKFRQDTLSTTGDSCIHFLFIIQVLSSGIIAYLGAFPIQYRDQTIQQWKDLFLKLNITFSSDYSLQNILSDPITIGQWTNSFKLPNDSFSIDNAIILKNSTRWPLMIDPQTQANVWIKKFQASRNIKIMRPTQSINEINLQLQSSIQFGFPVLLENVTEDIDQIFEPILQKKLIKQQGTYKIKLGDGKFIDYNTDFCFYMTTKLPRPHYPPEICVKVTLLNFQVTALGLEDQMTNIVVYIEEPIKDRQRQTNIEEFFNNKEKQRLTEDLILKLLNQASGNILDDEKLILTLQTSKVESNEIELALKKQEHFQIMFDGIRRNYNPVAQRISNLYFVILDMALIEPTYQWSLEFYIQLFIKSIEKAAKDKENRINNIIDKFQEMLYDSICRSLLEKDKLIFSLLICQKILEIKKKINSVLIRFVMVGGTLTDAPKPIPSQAKWLSNKAWCTIIEMDSVLPEFKGFLEDFEKILDQWNFLFNHENPIDQPLPGRWDGLSMYERLVIIRILFPQKFSQGVMQLIQTEMGKNFITPPPFDLEFSVKDGTPFTPLIFILSPGADPRLEILNTADKLGKKTSFMQISLGQGQEQIAESSIQIGIREGRWVLLQNCHLAPSFMPQLERILEGMESRKDVDSDFRIWLTSMPSEIFPPVILMKGIKMTYEPPRGMKNNLLRVFSTEDKKSFEDCSKNYEWKKLFFGLAFFHGLILERRKFGPLGWNIPYEFTMADFTISCSQLKMFLNEYEEIPWEALNYMVAEANYGGRVTDAKDRRLINVILSDFYTEKVLVDNYKYSKSGIYYSPKEGNLQIFIEHINNMPLRQETEIFGLHPNAEITSAIMETNSICNTVLSLLPRSVGGAGATPDEIIKYKCKQILQKLPKQFDQDAVQKSHPVVYKESMNTVLQQELIRFNKLLNIIRTSVINLGKAIDGLLTMSNDLEQVFDSIFDNKQPELWQKNSYPSLKPLGSYLNNFIERLQFIQKWIDEGSPPTYWISGFFFTQSFLTGTMQNYARKHQIPIDTLSFDFIVLNQEKDEKYDLKRPPADGCYIYGLFMDGAKWDRNLACISESLPMELYSDIPFIWLVPTAVKRNYDDDKSIYCCPTYKTSQRRGVLSTTGHSTNFVFDMYLSIHKDSNPNYWVKMGVAAITQLDD